MERAWAYATAITNINQEVEGKPERYTILQVKEDIRRLNLTDVNVSSGGRGKINTPRSGASELSRRIGVARETINYYLVMLDTPEEVQEAVDSGELPSSYAWEISRVPEERRERVSEIVLEGKRQGTLTRGKDIRTISSIVETLPEVEEQQQLQHRE